MALTEAEKRRERFERRIDEFRILEIPRQILERERLRALFFSSEQLFAGESERK